MSGRKKEVTKADVFIPFGTVTVEQLNQQLLSGKSWNDDGPRHYARTGEQKNLKMRKEDFEMVWRACYRYFAMHLGRKVERPASKGTTELVKWNYAGLLYNFLLYKTDALKRLRFRLSEIGLSHQKVMRISGLDDYRNMREAIKTLTRTGLIKITDRSSNKEDWTVELQIPPNPGKRLRLSATTKKHGHVSAVNPKMRTHDHSEEIDAVRLADDGN
jgi:hypothetical protein